MKYDVSKLVNTKRGKWTIIAEAPKQGYNTCVLTRCECGTESIKKLSELMTKPVGGCRKCSPNIGRRKLGKSSKTGEENLHQHTQLCYINTLKPVAILYVFISIFFYIGFLWILIKKM